MEYLQPDFYKKFKCTAGECPDSCCTGWAIVVDDKTLNRYKRVESAYANRLVNSIDKEEGVYLQCNGRCAFLNEENLCDIHAELGEEFLCRTCRTYPRHVEEYENIRERSLSLSCPVAAELILDGKNMLKLDYFEKGDMDEVIDGFDYLLFDKLLAVRDSMLEIVRDEKISMKTRMAMVLGMAHDVEMRIMEENYFGIEDVISKYCSYDEKKRMANVKKFEIAFQKKYADEDHEEISEMKRFINQLDRFELLRDEWKSLYESISQINKNTGNEKRIAQLFSYFIYVHYLGAIYHYRDLGMRSQSSYKKIKAAVYSTLVITAIAGSRIGTSKIFIDTAYRYSREIEHSDDNINALEEMVGKEKIDSFMRAIEEVL